MNYTLNKPEKQTQKASMITALRKLYALVSEENRNIVVAFTALLVNSVLNLISPVIVGLAIDRYISKGQYQGIITSAVVLVILYIVAFFASYIQTKTMGTVGQRLLFNLRNAIFSKLQGLPVAFFNQNKVGDLISRINNDTDKLNQFFSQSLMQFVGNLFMIVGAAIFIISINVRLGIAALAPALLLLIVTKSLSGWVKRKNATNLQAVGGMSAEIQESLNNFKVIVAFNRRDYFRESFEKANQSNYKSAVKAGVANNIFVPIYSLVSQAAQLIVLLYGIYLISAGNFTIGLLISFLAYISRFYDPLRQIATLWSSFQLALASWDRISDILSLESDLIVMPESKTKTTENILEFRNVHFHYPEGTDVLRNINFSLQPGKTYAFVGPTGGGKTTTASLMARLYDPTEGTVSFVGRDLRSFSTAERTRRIGFILQEPFLFAGTIRDNIVYGNEELRSVSVDELLKVLQKSGLESLVSKFEKGLDTKVSLGGETMSLGQRQLIAFIRAVLRRPDLIILDEATANIDTVTEQLLENILSKLPSHTTKVIIAHRLNTIENADQIFFVNTGEITEAGSLDHALSLLMEGKQES